MLFVREKRKEREQNKHTTKDLALFAFFAFFADHYSFLVCQRICPPTFAVVSA